MSARLRPRFQSLAPAAAIFLLALLPRLIGLTWGLPNSTRWYSYHPDESLWQIVGAVANMVRESGFNPHFFNYPSLTIYLTYFVYIVMSGLGLGIPSEPGFPWQNSHDIILAGRLVSAFCGAGTAVVTYLLARRFTSAKAALLAGILAAIVPGLVQHSHFATVDVPATFFVALCLLLTARAGDSNQLLWAAAIAGLAAGAKYNAIIVLVAPLVALWLMPSGVGRRLAASACIILLAFIVFFVTTPYALLSFAEFWGDPSRQSGFAYELLFHPRQGSGDLFTNTGNGWWYHLTFNLPFVLTWPVLLAGLAGLFLTAKDRRYWPGLAFFLLFFLTLGTSQVRFMRYVLPLVPVLCLLISAAVSRPEWPRALRQMLAGLLILSAAIGLSNVMLPLIKQDPRDQAAAVLKGQRVALLENPWFFTPPFQPEAFNTPVPGIESVGTNFKRLSSLAPIAFTISEFEWREKLRQFPTGPMATFLSQLDAAVAKGQATRYTYGHTILPFGLQRSFRPTDYIYTDPETRVYLLNPAK